MNASTKMGASLLALSLLAFSGCDSPEVDEGTADGRDDAFLGGGKADGAISEDSDDARAVLALANSASFEVLDDSDEVGLDVRAADGVYSRRVGPDTTANTADDVPFETLAQLDAVPWVGPSAFGKLLEYALAHGFGEVSCDEGILLGDRCYLVDDEEISEVPVSEGIHNYTVGNMRLHFASGGFTVTGTQNLYESSGYVRRGMWAQETAEGWSYSTSSADSYIVDGMIAPNGSLGHVQLGPVYDDDRMWLSAGNAGCDTRSIGPVSRAFAAYNHSGSAVAVGVTPLPWGRVLVCTHGVLEQINNVFASEVGVRFTDAGKPQVLVGRGTRLSVYERHPATGWGEVSFHELDEYIEDTDVRIKDMDVVEAPNGQTYVYVGTATFTNSPTSGDLTVAVSYTHLTLPT
ncbi:MAG: hypothetical protein KUG77_24255, partial [Nannocystaceae bacterium]|nr:hypothetical protein [Nannocystaceae bacterium]